MTEDQAYSAMFSFLDDYYSRNKSADLGQLLGELQLADDGKPFDPVVANERKLAVRQTLKEE